MAFVQDVVYRIISPGQTLTIWGGFFDGNCEVYFGSKKASVIDYDEEKIEVLAPIELGEYKVTLDDGSKVIDVCDVSVVDLASTPQRNAPKDYTDNDFFNYVLSLLPRGNAIATRKDSFFGKLLTAISTSVKYVWDTIRSMVVAVDPTHTENFNEWEGELNLPVIGIYPDTLQGRRAEIYRVECSNGGCSVEYIKKMLFLMGIDADVYEYTKNPEQFASIDFGGDDPRFYLRIVFHLQKEDFVQFRAGVSCAGDYLLDFTQYMEEAVFEQIKQAHIKIVYGYEEVVGNYITDDFGIPLTDEHGTLLTY